MAHSNDNNNSGVPTEETNASGMQAGDDSPSGFGHAFGPGPYGGVGAGEGASGNDRGSYSGRDKFGAPLASTGAYTQKQGARGSSAGSGNLGLSRRVGPKRVVGAGKSISSGEWGADVTKSYSVSTQLQFNEVDELRPDSISHDFAQELIETLFFEKWGLDSGNASVMRKAEDVLHSFLVMRTASPYASYSLTVMIGGKQVELEALSDLLIEREVQRRRFARAVADDLRKYILVPENAYLRNILITKLGVYPQYVHLAFDGSTHCTKMNRNEIAFTKSLESSKLFDDESVRGSLNNSSVLDGVFETAGSGQRKRPA